MSSGRIGANLGPRRFTNTPHLSKYSRTTPTTQGFMISAKTGDDSGASGARVGHPLFSPKSGTMLPQVPHLADQNIAEIEMAADTMGRISVRGFGAMVQPIETTKPAVELAIASLAQSITGGDVARLLNEHRNLEIELSGAEHLVSVAAMAKAWLRDAGEDPQYLMNPLLLQACKGMIMHVTPLGLAGDPSTAGIRLRKKDMAADGRAEISTRRASTLPEKPLSDMMITDLTRRWKDYAEIELRKNPNWPRTEESRERYLHATAIGFKTYLHRLNVAIKANSVNALDQMRQLELTTRYIGRLLDDLSIPQIIRAPLLTEFNNLMQDFLRINHLSTVEY